MATKEEVLRQIEEFIRNYGRALGPQKTWNAIKSRWGEAFKDPKFGGELKREAGRMMRAAFSREEWKKEELRLKEEEFKPYKPYRQPRLRLLFVLVGLFITFFPWLPFDMYARFFILLGLAIVCYPITYSRGATAILLLCAVFQFSFFPVAQGWAEQYGITDAWTRFNKEVLCKWPCVIGTSLSMRQPDTDVLINCEMDCGIIQLHKEGCKDCLIITADAKREPTINGETQTVEAVLRMDTNTKPPLPAKDIWVEIIDEKGLLPYRQNRCTSEEKCELEPGDSETVVVVFDTVSCKNIWRYNVTASYDYSVSSENSFKIRKTRGERAQSTSTGDLGSSSSGPLSLGLATDLPEYIAGEDKHIFLSIYIINEGKGIIDTEKIEVTQITSPVGRPGLRFEGCLKTNVPGRPNVDYDETQKKLTITDIPWIRSKGSDIVTCEFEVPSSIEEDFLTYTFKAEADYEYRLTVRGEETCRESSAITV